MVASNPGSAQAAFTILARDKAIGVVKDFSSNITTATRALTTFAGGAARANAIMTVLSLTIPLVTAALASLVVVRTSNTLVTFERAARRADLQLQILGLSATDANVAIGLLGGALDRVTATSLFMSKQGIDQVAVAGVTLALELANAAATLEDKFGIPFQEAFNALFQARVFDNPGPLLAAVGGIERLGITIDQFNNLNAQQLASLILTMADAAVVTNAEKLADAFERIALLTQPSREHISEFIAGMLNVLIESLAFHLEEIESSFSDALIGGLILAFAVAGRGLAPSFAAGFIGFAGTIIVRDLEAFFDLLKEDPKIILPIAAAALAIGFLFGSVLAGVAVLAVGGALLPGLQAAFDELSTSDQITLVVLLIGTAIGKKLGLSLVQALGLGGLLAGLAGDIAKGKGEEGKLVQTAFILAGTALGSIIGKSAQGGLIGAMAGNIIFKIFEEWLRPLSVWLEDIMEAIAFNAAISFVNTFIGAIRGMVGLLQATVNDFLMSFNRLIDAYNVVARLIGAPLADKIGPVNFGIPDFIPIRPVPIPFFGGGGESGPNIPPGFVGVPGGGTITVQLILDRQVLDEIILDTVSGDIHQRAGVVPGAVGV